MLQPLLDRNRYTDEEWALASEGRCNQVVESGMVPGRVLRCGQSTDPRSVYRWCMDCDFDAREENPAGYGR